MSHDADNFEQEALGYLLGRLAEEAAERFETRLLEEDRAEELTSIEDELIDRAVHGELRPDERGPFDSHFRHLPGREAKIRFAGALYQAARASAPVPITSAPANRRRAFARSTWFAAAGMAAAAGLLVFLALRGPPGPQDVAALRAPDMGTGMVAAPAPVVPGNPPSPSPAPPPLPIAPRQGPAPDTETPEPEPPPVMLALALSSTRGAADRQLVIPARARRVILSIDLEGETSFSAFRATLTGAGGTTAWTANRLAPDRSGVLTLRVPAATLMAGSYRLAIGGIGADGQAEDLGTFPLQIVRGAAPRH